MVPAPEDNFTLTEARDWPLLLTVGGLLVAVIGGMWIDLKSTIKDNRQELRQEINSLEQDFKDENRKVWTAIEDCRGMTRQLK